MFAVAATEPGARYRLSFKCSDGVFAELLEREGIAPAPHMARAKWVALESWDALADREIESRIGEAYEIVLSKLPKKDQTAIRSAGRRTRKQ